MSTRLADTFMVFIFLCLLAVNVNPGMVSAVPLL